MSEVVKLKNEDRQVMLDYLLLEYTGQHYITYDILDGQKCMEIGTASIFLKTLLKETGWEVEHETPSGRMVKLRRINGKDVW